MNRIKTYLTGLGRSTRVLVLALAVVVAGAGVAQAATTISTNITTAGTLSVTGLATLLGGATTTQITLLSGDTIKNASASSTVISGALQTTGGLSATTGTFSGAVSSVGLTGTTGTFSGLASTSALKVGDEPAAPTINGMVFGYCSFGDVTLAASSTDGFASCTTVPAGALVAGDRVFVQATSSFDQAFVITAASTTGVSTIQLRIMNTGLGGADGTLGGTSVNFWALR
ncbi:MAG: hypothetical protein WCW36_01430 [Candidatus Paceibacterota bacterium]